MEWTGAVLLGLGAYLLGSVPTAYILVRLAKGIDIRQVGTGNVGALNTFQQVGIWGGLMVLVVDAGKGALSSLAPSWAGAPEWTVFLTTPLVVAGHNWPVFLGFRGGKRSRCDLRDISRSCPGAHPHCRGSHCTNDGPAPQCGPRSGLRFYSFKRIIVSNGTKRRPSSSLW